MREQSSHVVRPIGFVRSPFGAKVEAPRQGIVARDVTGTIEVLPAHAHALADLETFDRIWILFWFDRADAGVQRAKVQPPRSDRKRGVFATRSPHRPNPIGMTAVRLDRIEGRVLHVRDLDLLDETPVLDIKPYLAYADAFPEASAGWLDKPDPVAPWSVAFTREADDQLAWIAERSAIDVRARIITTLSLGPEPLPYRRIKRIDTTTSVLAIKDWRATFEVTGRTLTVVRLTTGYRDRELHTGTLAEHELHRAFVSRFS